VIAEHNEAKVALQQLVQVEEVLEREDEKMANKSMVQELSMHFPTFMLRMKHHFLLSITRREDLGEEPVTLVSSGGVAPVEVHLVAEVRHPVELQLDMDVGVNMVVVEVLVVAVVVVAGKIGRRSDFILL
jgi:hypothetical protein